MSWSKVVAACAVAATMSTITACSQQPSKNAAKTTAMPTKATSSTTPSPIDQAKQAALTAYKGMWTDYADAARTADYKDQQLTHHATGAALTAMVQSLYWLQQQGLVIKGTLATTPRVVDMVPADAPTRIDIKDCASDVDWLQYVAATGKLKDDARGGHRIVTARVTHQYDLWRVAGYQVQAEGTC